MSLPLQDQCMLRAWYCRVAVQFGRRSARNQGATSLA